MNYSDFIVESLQKATKISNENFGKMVGSTTKPEDNNQVLTQTDLEIGKFLVGEVGKNYPEYNVVDEEAGVIDRGSKFTWVIDPIDGTSNFANGLPTFGIMIGLLEGDRPIVGGIALPFFGEIYVAEKGKGAFCNGEKISVSSEKALLKSLVAYGIDGHQEDPKITRDEAGLLSKIVLGIRNLRSSNSVFDTAMVARGKYGAFLNRTSKIWDNVAQQIVIEEAGGVYTDFFGKPMDYSNPLSKAKNNFTFCAGSMELHRQLQGIIQNG